MRVTNCISNSAHYTRASFLHTSACARIRTLQHKASKKATAHVYHRRLMSTSRGQQRSAGHEDDEALAKQMKEWEVGSMIKYVYECESGVYVCTRRAACACACMCMFVIHTVGHCVWLA